MDNPAKILLIEMIEDDTILSSMLLNMLQNEGFEVVAALDGSQGYELARGKRPDLILIDHILPGISGPETVEHLKNDPYLSSIPIIMLSNVGNPEEIKRVLELGVKKYLIKYKVTLWEVIKEIKKTLSEFEWPSEPSLPAAPIQGQKEETVIKVTWDEKVCIHSGNCVKNLPKVFKVEDGKFVIDEKGASEDAIKAAVAQCPSGALKIVKM